MGKIDFVNYIKDDKLYIDGKPYDLCSFKHLHEVKINGKNMLLEYYQRVSSPNDDKLLDGWKVWLYGDDRPQNPPHIHLMKGDFNIEIHLHNFEVYHMEAPQVKNITWDDVSKKLKDGFFQWLEQPSKSEEKEPNWLFLFRLWNGNNENTIRDFIEKNRISDIHPLVKKYLYGSKIKEGELISQIFQIVLPLYQNDKVTREDLHNIEDPIDFAKTVGLPFDFNENNVTEEIKHIIKEHERMSYEMSKYLF